MTEVTYHADRILHMADGRIVGDYNPRDVTIPELEERVYA